ncbi:WhiB family transcriptional regulator [Demequina gelatinilytica]|uniref:WhiB family transcriptional regulator n=1 Tax=Demequina gelatinilytica TaxID=1638980 RepID=UPI0009E591BE
MGALDWQADALCAQVDPEVFFPGKGGSTREAKWICSRCDVREKCLEWAIANDISGGTIGGLSDRERAKVRRARGIPSADEQRRKREDAAIAARAAAGLDVEEIAASLAMNAETVRQRLSRMNRRPAEIAS